MIHKIKALHDNGKGLSIRAISQELGLSRNTVRKYLRMPVEAISDQLADPSRSKRLDDHRGYLEHLLQSFPKLSAVKIARKLQAKVGELPASDRSIRRYVRTLKAQVATAQVRYYEPMLDDLPGVQCQVDPGELRKVMVGDQERTLHFVVFVLSYSRLMYVGVVFRPLDTQLFIQLHDEAMRYFGGLPQECVYDQTKLVVINEQYRELTLNQRFHAYATTAGFRIHACEGYDPESKGKVEAGVKYVKQDCLYGEVFRDQEHVREHVQQWLDNVANDRVHGTTGESPRERFERDEREHLNGYLSPACVQPVAGQTRRADKTGLIAWKANKYSVPMRWQQARVGVLESNDQLHISDLSTDEVIASHALCHDKGKVIKNTHHYRDHAQRVSKLEADIDALIGSQTGGQLCQQLKRSEPKIYKDQLVAVRELLKRHKTVNLALIATLAQRPGMTATRLQGYLEAATAAVLRERHPEPIRPSRHALDLSAYQQLGHCTGQEVTHEPA
ncbi:IS21 family transposase [Orrella marina]|uniref:IS21 family transposase n=1 Tax=Orrella marina TaxID=2163011 RepID=A0A2R4XPY6_9BURK|nr:IS21 family transposase [Orrella marina]AWB35851.1 IS21 family transposase [Orrella marina]